MPPSTAPSYPADDLSSSIGNTSGSSRFDRSSQSGRAGSGTKTSSSRTSQFTSEAAGQQAAQDSLVQIPAEPHTPVKVDKSGGSGISSGIDNTFNFDLDEDPFATPGAIIDIGREAELGLDGLQGVDEVFKVSIKPLFDRRC